MPFVRAMRIYVGICLPWRCSGFGKLFQDDIQTYVSCIMVHGHQRNIPIVKSPQGNAYSSRWILGPRKLGVSGRIAMTPLDPQLVLGFASTHNVLFKDVSDAVNFEGKGVLGLLKCCCLVHPRNLVHFQNQVLAFLGLPSGVINGNSKLPNIAGYVLFFVLALVHSENPACQGRFGVLGFRAYKVI